MDQETVREKLEGVVMGSRWSVNLAAAKRVARIIAVGACAVALRRPARRSETVTPTCGPRKRALEDDGHGAQCPRSQRGLLPLSQRASSSHTGGMARRLAATLLVAVTGLLGAIAVPQAAQAHGEGETQEGYLLVQQALGHLAHDTTPEGIDLAMEKVDDALSTKDQDGVDVAELKDGMRALDAGQVARARVLLQGSIEEALAQLPTATGYETGTTVVVSAMPGRTGLSGQDVGLLVASIAIAGLGLLLAYRFRPHDSIRELRGQLRAGGPTPGIDPTPSTDTERRP